MTMHQEKPEFLHRDGAETIAYHRTPGKSPGVIFLGGFMSDMTGTKATALEAWAQGAGRAFLRFDYTGHGCSGGRFTDGTISAWLEDACAVLDELTSGPQILVGSSMGGWIALHLALCRPDRVAGLVGIAAAPDFVDWMWEELGEEGRRCIEEEGVYRQPSAYSEEPYEITRALIEDGRKMKLLNGPSLDIRCPVRLLQGMRDPDVPWRHALKIAEKITHDDVRVHFFKGGDHRLSGPEELAFLMRVLEDMSAFSG